MKKLTNQKGSKQPRPLDLAASQRKAMAKARATGQFDGQSHLHNSPAGRAIATGMFDHMAY